ncbi:hypothetical protein B0H19DRAFT_1374572 [Mycena capillaripes]|nr:hypothetical protein B0H19DRAFT_1374572 [Mycena capillaripes]
MDSANIAVDPRLPPDLERVIFEIAARARPSTIPKLMLIAWRVKDWLEPLMYRVIYLCTPLSERQMHCHSLGFPVFTEESLLHIMEIKPAHFLRHAVTHAFLNVSIPPPVVERFLLTCTNIANLFARFILPQYGPTLNDPQALRYLTIDVSAISEGGADDEPHSLFLNVTHLELLGFGHVDSAALCARLGNMPNLTHIAFNMDLDDTTALQANARLQCIIYLMAETAMGDGAALLRDSRFLCIEQKRDYRLDWLRGAHAGEDYWALADEFLAARRAGKVNSSIHNIADDDNFWRV